MLDDNDGKYETVSGLSFRHLLFIPVHYRYRVYVCNVLLQLIEVGVGVA